ncbi:MAG: hypothetical protein NC432_07260 [Roseburia sp.]|nr:hypothetical protein [Roseburia sp.]MCM1098951.1 hypothetical protein [Ruminococcus flavefaciens]
MKCEYCNGTLSLEDAVCPHCGRPNRHAEKHIEEMQRYAGEFENTKRYVQDKTSGYAEIVVRVVILSVLAVLSLVFFIIGRNAGDIMWNAEKIRAEMRFEEYSRILDEYLEDEDYLMFNAFCLERGIRTYDSAYGEKYGEIIYACFSYGNAYSYLYEYVLLRDGYQEHAAEFAGDMLEYFYERYRNEDFFYTGGREEPEEYRRTLERMERNLERILTAYCGVTEEEAAMFSEMSKAKRTMILEERLEERLQDGK